MTLAADRCPQSRILLVDDRPANLLALEALLEPLGQKLVEVQSGEEALRRLTQDDFAVVLLDVAMPGMDGYETARLLRNQERSRQTPIIFVTAHETPDAGVIDAYSLGAVDFLVKPIVPVILRSKVAVFVELYLKTEEIKRQQERLRQQQEEVLRTEQLAAVGRLAAGIAHEIRNPLAAIKLLVEGALLPQTPRPLSREQLTVLHGEATRLERTVQEFLDFARPPTLHRRLQDVWGVVTQAASLVRPRAQRQNVQLLLHPPAAPVPVEVDHGQLGTVFVNLFLNALDVLPRGGVLEVYLERLAEGARLAIHDNGPGIPPEILEQLFTPFLTSKPTGMGLGLWISRRIVEEHGGRITLANGPGGGTCVTIALPIAEA
jgi:signal transduction histidine kinase